MKDRDWATWPSAPAQGYIHRLLASDQPPPRRDDCGRHMMQGCISYCPVAVTKHHDQKKPRKKGVVLVLERQSPIWLGRQRQGRQRRKLADQVSSAKRKEREGIRGLRSHNDAEATGFPSV